MAAQIAVPLMVFGPEKPEPKVKERAQVKKRARPNFPREMLKQGVGGDVLVGFVIDEKGKVTDARVMRSSHREFEDAALECVRKWTFEPAREDGVAVKSRMQVPIVFNPRSR
jgi:periplasmic protein TonB